MNFERIATRKDVESFNVGDKFVVHFGFDYPIVSCGYYDAEITAIYPHHIQVNATLNTQLTKVDDTFGKPISYSTCLRKDDIGIIDNESRVYDGYLESGFVILL